MNTLVQSFLTHCKIERGLSPNTLDAYTRDLACFLNFLGDTPVKSVVTENLSAHLAFLGSEGKSAATCNRHRMTLVAFYRFLGMTVADGLEPAKDGVRLPNPLPTQVVTQMIERTECKYDRLVLELLYCCGLRASELRDFQISGSMLRVIGKGDKERMVPCPESVLDRIRYDGAMVKTYSRFQVYNAVRRAGRRIGVDAHPHQLRHSFATDLLKGGANIRVVQELLGHSCVETTERYTKVDPTKLKETIREFHPRP